MGEQLEYPIPRDDKPDLTGPLNQISLTEALSEQGQMGAPWSPKWRERYDWGMRFVLRPILFLAVIILNIWWDVNVSRLVWSTAQGWIKLDTSVLVALVTTSTGNFIALVIIVAKHLFPEMKSDSK